MKNINIELKVRLVKKGKTRGRPSKKELKAAAFINWFVNQQPVKDFIIQEATKHCPDHLVG